MKAALQSFGILTALSLGSVDESAAETFKEAGFSSGDRADLTYLTPEGCELTHWKTVKGGVELFTGGNPATEKVQDLLAVSEDRGTVVVDAHCPIYEISETNKVLVATLLVSESTQERASQEDLVPLYEVIESEPEFYDCDTSEKIRLNEEIRALAARGIWSGVERQFRAMQRTECELSSQDWHTGAEAARHLGNVDLRLSRLIQGNANPDEIAFVESHFAPIELEGNLPCSLSVATLPFQPDAVAAIQFAKRQVEVSCHFDGWLPKLPEGETYTFETAGGSQRLILGE